VLATDGEPVAAMVRSADHWLTNAAKGADVEEFELDAEAKALVERASDAVGGGLLGIDLMETGDSEAQGASDGGAAEPRNGYTIHEVNHTVEFKALTDAASVDVPAAVVDWLEAKVEQGKAEVVA